MRALKRDSNEPEIVKALRDEGWSVMRLNEFDLLVTCGDGCCLHMLEVKTPTGALKPSQKKMIKDGWPLKIVRSVEEALNAVAE